MQFGRIHADFAGNFAGGGGHHLHQAGGAHAGAYADHEAAFLADDAVGPGGIDIGLGGVAAHAVAEGGDIAQVVVDLAVGFIGGINAHLVEAGIMGKLGGGE